MKKRLSAARREIIHAYETVKQFPKGGSIVKQVAIMLDRPIDKNGNHSFIRKVIKEYKEDLRTQNG